MQPTQFPEQIKRAGTDLVLSLRHWAVESGSPRAWVFIMHGLGEHSGRYAPLAAFLNKNGIAVVAIDHEGHGRSGGATRGYIPYWQPVVNDALFAIDLAHKFFGPIPKFLLGHSMGGALAILTAQKRPSGFEWNGVIFSAPALQKGAEVSDMMVWAGRTLAWVMPRVAAQKVPPEQITSIPEEVKRYQEDPLNYHGGIMLGTGSMILDMMDTIQVTADKMTLPILLLQGEEDRICDPAGAKKYYEMLPSKDKKLILYPKIHYDVEREKEEQDILRWVTARMTSSAKL